MQVLESQSIDLLTLKPCGSALEDVAVGAWVYERARQEQVGRKLPIEFPLEE